MRMFTEIGQRVDLHSTGSARHSCRSSVRRILTTYLTGEACPAVPSTPSLVAFGSTRNSSGFDRPDSIDEQEVEVRCLAFPIAGLSSGMAVSVSGPVTRMTESLVEPTVPLQQSAARALAGSLERSD